ncbi:complement factor H-related protein 1 isoform X5 [Labrus bergylta]|uniref:complement factor H-related protein 1 isoform X5 n=1 Tax=Labrus bergylta TaxID=56723 RepID=UPI00331367D6
MWVRYLGFVILFGLPGALHAQPCGAPGLDGGYFVPLQETYSHEIEIIYACDSGRKPAVEGWWATSTCQNGVWSPEPQCIGEEDCLPPEIPNAKFNKKQNSWYNEGNTIRVTCDNGYELKNRDATAVCLNGTWTSVPVCEISNNTCGEPPQIPHAVIIGQKYQASFAADSKVRYKCEDGYSVEGAESKKSIFCISGSWSELPKCSSGSSAGGTAGGHPTSTESGTQPGGGGSSTTSVSNDRNSKPAFIPVNECGVSPVIPNGVVVQTERMYLKYECNSYYTRVGPDTVVCTNDGRWSELPSCKEAFCVLDLAQYSGIGIRQTGKEYIKEGETKNVYCSYYDYVIFTCTQGRVTYTRCCEAYYHNYGGC